ncbi:hypothetical protein BN903_69 [Halorubrum sp. AJ67]|nr:hypothetical protein BN903_69 [Halorubrum sp. AJ67]
MRTTEGRGIYSRSGRTSDKSRGRDVALTADMSDVFGTVQEQFRGPNRSQTSISSNPRSPHQW